MTKTDIEEIIQYLKDRMPTSSWTRIYNPAVLDMETFCKFDAIVNLLEQYPVSEEQTANDPLTEDALFAKYESLKKAGFDPAQAFDLTREYYENMLSVIRLQNMRLSEEAKSLMQSV